MSRQIKLGAFLIPSGHHVGAWRHPDVPADSGLNFPFYKQLAQTAERALFDAIFVADNVAVTLGQGADKTARADYFEPLTLMAALSAVTENIGLICTQTTSFNEPYHIARKFASLDYLSGGRAGWNLVTSDVAAEATNFGREEHFNHAERYERANEFYEVVTGLWDSWDDDAFVRNKASGQYFDPEKLHVLNHKGKHFSVSGPLNVARPIQGRPVVVQAGSSEAGRSLAAKTADVVFTAHPALKPAQDFYRDIKTRAAQHGRDPDSVKIMPGIYVVVGKTESEAQEKFEQLQHLIDPAAGLALLSRMIGNFDLSGYPVDEPLPELPLTETGQRSRQALLTGLAKDGNLTIRQLYTKIAGGRGHNVVIGTAKTVADVMQEWFEQEAADGFNLLSPSLPNGLTDFAELVVPELQARGLFRTAYEGKTLRENLGLSRPVSRYRVS